MKVISADFIKSASDKSHWPALDLPQIAFAGRSNVGKSSLINTITNRKGLVKVSKTPGKTQLLNFFRINMKFIFTDMPGYGFANVPVSMRQSWRKMVETYLKESDSLMGVVSLLDIRRTPNEDDLSLLGWLSENEIPFVLVFTKVDKLSKSQQAKSASESMKVISHLAGPMIGKVMFSAHTGQGRDELWALIKRMLDRE